MRKSKYYKLTSFNGLDFKLKHISAKEWGKDNSPVIYSKRFFSSISKKYIEIEIEFFGSVFSIFNTRIHRQGICIGYRPATTISKGFFNLMCFVATTENFIYLD